MTVTEVGSSRFVPARELKRGDQVIVANTVKRIVSDPYVVGGYVYCDVDNVLGLGRGPWNFGVDTDVSVFSASLVPWSAS